MSNKLDAFEEGVKHAVSSFEAPYDPKAWESLSQNLDGYVSSSTSLTSGFTSGMLAGVLAVAAWMGVITGFSSTDTLTTSTEEILSITEPEERSAGDPINSRDLEKDIQAVEVLTEKQNRASEVVVERVTEDVDENATHDLREVSNTQQSVSGADIGEYTIRVESPSSQLCLGESPHLIITTKGLFEDEQILVNGVETEEPIRFELPGTYEIIPQGIIGDKTISGEPLLIEVLKRPTSRINQMIGKDRYGRQELTLSIGDASDLESVQWFVNNEVVASGVTHKVIVTKADLYQITSVGADANGCTDTSRTSVSVSESYNLLAPSAFTPNGDGRNDTWMPEALMGIDLPFTLVIYDSKGQPVFETSNSYATWTGKVSGEPVIPGSVYVWKSTVEFPEGTHNFTGSITIVE